MKPLSRLLTSAAVFALVGSASPGEAQTRPAPSPSSVAPASLPVGRRPAPGIAQLGRIAGRVTDESGAPAAGAVVTVMGTTQTAGVSDADGRFMVDGLVPGTYVVRAHRPGFASAQRETKEVGAGATAEAALLLRRVGATAAPAGPVNTLGATEPRPIMTAGAGGDSQPEATAADKDGESRTASRLKDDDHGETAWWLRHLRRSVLKDATTRVVGDGLADSDISNSTIDRGRFASALFADLPLTGQINLLTMSAFDSPQELFTGRVPLGVAYFSIGAPVGPHANWTINGVMTQGDVASWILAGSYTSKWPDAHVFELGMSYGTQRYQGGNAAALAAAIDGNRSVGGIQAFDHWQMSKRVSLDYGTRYARYDYVPGPGLLSPRASISFALEPSTHVRASVWQRMRAPGAEEFLPPTQSNLWLPPERTFAPMVNNVSNVSSASRDVFQAERARHLEIAFEHGREWVIGVRRFQQDVDNQIVNVFGVREMPGPRTDLGHYYVANAGHAETSGWGLSLSRPMAHRFRGSVSYTVTNASWTPASDAALLTVIAPIATRRLGTERFHDVTTSLESDFPETATRVFVIYKVNTAFSKPNVDNPRPGADVRFDVQINQALPFLRFTNTQWEVLVAVRNLFHDQGGDGSVYDELMVIRPPKRIVGGLTVRF